MKFYEKVSKVVKEIKKNEIVNTKSNEIVNTR